MGSLDAMPALSPAMISILEGCLRAGATCAVISRTAATVRLVRGDAPLGAGDLPADTFAPLTTELRALGGRDGARSEITVHSPVGPLRLSVEIEPDELRVFFPVDSDEAAAEVTFSKLMAQATSLGADRVLCARDQTAFFKGKELVAVAALDHESRALLVAHGRRFVAEGQRTGSGILFSAGGARRTLDVALSDAGVAFSVRS
jgi:hypothetical protein